MGIKRKKVQVYEINYECDFCKKGFMVAEKIDGFITYSGKKVFHRCNKCEKYMYLNREYPFQTTE